MDNLQVMQASAELGPRFAEALLARIGPQKYNAWFKHATRALFQDGRVKILVPTPFAANWIEGHYHDDVAAAAQTATGSAAEVAITVDPELGGEVRKRQLDSQAEIVAKASDGRARPRVAPAAAALRHRLDDFVVGESNRMAFTAAMAVAGGQRAMFNPLFIHGPCGVGKTHLLQGICNQASQRRDGALRWRYVTGEQFTNDFVTSLRNKKLDEFRARYRKLDLLAIDDVHFLANKKATQDEFLHTYNAIESAGKQVVMASDAHPRLVGDLNEQLVSRFVAGMVVKVSSPDSATRTEILRRRAAAMKLQLPADVLQYVAAHIRGSVRELEGTIIKLAALATLEGSAITVQTAAAALADHMARTDSVVTLSDIETATAAFFGLTPADIHSSRRTQTVSVARMVAIFLARRHTRMSFPEIGKSMGKNHSSAVLAVKRMESILTDGGELQWLTPTGPRKATAEKVVAMLSEGLG
jgi:chromosomal replication initiator protein